MPSAACPGVTAPSPASAIANPATIIEPVSQFGIRRLRMSVTTATARPAASTTKDNTVITSEVGGNGLPEHRVNRLPDRRDRADRDDRDQCGEKSVFQQVLSIIREMEPRMRHSEQRFDGFWRLHRVLLTRDQI